jgi:hypothetical protein
VEAQIREDDPTYLGTAGTKNYLADAIQKGDTVKDNHGQQMIKVLDKRVVPAEITVNTSDGRVIKATDPMREDVFLTLEILAGKIDGRYYLLNNVPILVDQPIPFNTLTVSVFPTVTKFLSY